MTHDELLKWLREEDENRLAELWRMADETRRARVGDEVHLRGLVEISNYCSRRCGYCGIRSENVAVERYRMTADEVLGCAHQAAQYGYGTLVMQAGEDYAVTQEWLRYVIGRIKSETPLAVTLSLGERPDEDLVAWREAGADRYLLRFETSDPGLYRMIHPPASRSESSESSAEDRLGILRRLQDLGYEAGSGVMIGIPGQTYDILGRDILTFAEMDLDMIGVGPYISHPDTPLGRGEWASPAQPGQQVPNTELMTYKVVALTRLVCPEANIPSTTALATLNKAAGRELGLQRGANVVMPNLTPVEYRQKYQIYPAKVCMDESGEDCRACMRARIRSIGRTPGRGPGGRLRRVGEHMHG